MKQFAIFKNTKKENDKQPDYKLSAKIDDVYVEVGAGWIKEGKTGKFIAVKLADNFNEKPGFTLEMEKSIQPNFEKDSKGVAMKSPAETVISADEDINPEDIPF